MTTRAEFAARVRAGVCIVAPLNGIPSMLAEPQVAAREILRATGRIDAEIYRRAATGVISLPDDAF